MKDATKLSIFPKKTLLFQIRSREVLLSGSIVLARERLRYRQPVHLQLFLDIKPGNSRGKYSKNMLNPVECLFDFRCGEGKSSCTCRIKLSTLPTLILVIFTESYMHRFCMVRHIFTPNLNL